MLTDPEASSRAFRRAAALRPGVHAGFWVALRVSSIPCQPRPFTGVSPAIGFSLQVLFRDEINIEKQRKRNPSAPDLAHETERCVADSECGSLRPPSAAEADHGYAGRVCPRNRRNGNAHPPGDNNFAYSRGRRTSPTRRINKFGQRSDEKPELHFGFGWHQTLVESIQAEAWLALGVGQPARVLALPSRQSS